jgi:hypothetical protein
MLHEYGASWTFGSYLTAGRVQASRQQYVHVNARVLQLAIGNSTMHDIAWCSIPDAAVCKRNPTSQRVETCPQFFDT